MNHISIPLDLANQVRDNLRDLRGSASTNGCEYPLAVIDGDKLEGLASAFLPIAQQIDQANEAAKTSQANGACKKVVTFVFDVRETSSFGAKSPQFAVVEVTRTMLDRLNEVVSIANLNALTSCTAYNAPDYWGPGNIADELCLSNPELVITGLGDMWFSGSPKHANYEIQSASKSIKELEQEFEGAPDGDFVLLLEDEAIAIKFHEDAIGMLTKELAEHGIAVNGSDFSTCLALTGILPEVQLMLAKYDRHIKSLDELQGSDVASIPAMGE